MSTELVEYKGKLDHYTPAQSQLSEVLQFSEVRKVIKKTDALVINSTLKQSIFSFSSEEITKKMAEVVAFVCQDLGIVMESKKQYAYAATRLTQYLERYYSDMTFSEVKMAFEFLTVGKLDPWLPFDKHSQRDRKHYGKFNMEFYSKVFGAYHLYKMKVWNKLKGAYNYHKDKTSRELSQDEIESNDKAVIEEIWESFYNYKDKGVRPNFVLSLFIKEFVKRNLINLPEPKKEDFKRAFVIVSQNNHVPGEERKRIKRDYENGVIQPIIQTEAERIANNVTIKKYFDTLIKSKIDIKEVIK